MRFNLFRVSIGLSFAFIINGCGGGGNSITNLQTSEASSIKEATFIDGVVKGARYICGDIEGFTSKDGIFKYIEGQSVKFYAGNIFLGEAIPVDKPKSLVNIKTQKIVTPLELTNSKELNNSKVINLVKFLMAIDSDKNASNGIDINNSNRALDKNISINTTTSIKEAFKEQIVLPSPKEALEHISKSLGIAINFNQKNRAKDKNSSKVKSSKSHLSSSKKSQNSSSRKRSQSKVLINKNSFKLIKIEEDFARWSTEYPVDKSSFDKEVDINGSGWKWRTYNKKLVFRKRNGALVQLQGAKEGYFYTIFNNSFDASNQDATFKIDSSIGQKFNYRLMLKDETSWCISDNIEKDSLKLTKSSWHLIAKSDDITEAFNRNSSLPKLSNFTENCEGFDFENIQGIGVFYKIKKSNDNKGYFQLRDISLYKELPEYGVFESLIKEDKVSPLLFGLCTTPNRTISTSQVFINNYKKWVTYLRWPGGSMIEDYNLKDKSGKIYSVGEWTEFMKSKLPSLEFLIGVSSKRAYDGDWNGTTYGYELVNYLNRDYASGWGDNGALSNPINLKFVEIGNEPNLEGLNAQQYGPILKDYATGIHRADSSVKILAPTTTHGEIGRMLPEVLKNYGDNIDIISVHNYTDNPKDYKADLKLIKGYIQNLMRDNSRRKKDKIKIAFTEYNSLNVDRRKGVYHSESWAKVIWHSQTFSYFIQEGLYMASIWHSFFGGGHGVYERDGTPYPIISGIEFWKNSINFNEHPKVLYSYSSDKDIIITPIVSDSKLTVFVVNASPTDDKTISLEFKDNQFNSTVNIKTLTHTTLNEFYPTKTVASGVNIDNLRAKNPDAVIFEKDNQTKVKFPKLDISINQDSATLNGNTLIYTFPKYTISVLELSK